jgi:uncharacterized membrane protein
MHTPSAPGMEATGIPPGWSSNPSRAAARRRLLLLAFLGLLAAIYLTLYQWGAISHIWDPFFGEQSTYVVTHSAVSRILPFPDAALGVLGYLCDLLFGSLGGDERWWRQPWTVMAFVGTISALAAVSVLLIIAQAVVVHAWCTICLVSAGVSLLIFALGSGEGIATLQYLKRVRARARSTRAVWKAIWGHHLDIGAVRS